jgi:hypothetical protein
MVEAVLLVGQKVEMSILRLSSQCENFIATHGNKPRICLAFMTRSTPIAMAAVR